MVAFCGVILPGIVSAVAARLLEFAALFVWVAFCRVVLPDVVSAGVSKLLKHATSQVHAGCRQLTFDERVDHLICNTDDAFIENISRFFGVGIFLLPLSVLGWLLKSEDTWGPILWCLRVVGPGIILLCCVGTLRTVVRAVRRKRIRTMLVAERDRMDPHSTNPRIFVSRRDSQRRARVLFDLITAACYRWGMTVLQYTDFDWPFYVERFPASGIHPDAMPQPYSQSMPNPDAVRAASVLVWLDIGNTSPPMQLELEAARESHIPVVRLHRLSEGSESIVISQGAHIYGTVTLDTAAELTASVLEEILSAQIKGA
jgi:hypothetical protein